jgi:ADP-ribose pyrophosphatase YjhB (NUDIX family)
LLGVSIALFRENKVLLIKRAKPPFEHHYSLPGGLVEAGEILEDAARRELKEEVGMDAGPLFFNQHAEMIERDADGAIKRHYVVASFTGLWVAGDGRMNEEVSEILWTEPLALTALPLTPGLTGVIEAAQRIPAKTNVRG